MREWNGRVSRTTRFIVIAVIWVARVRTLPHVHIYIRADLYPPTKQLSKRVIMMVKIPKKFNIQQLIIETRAIHNTFLK